MPPYSADKPRRTPERLLERVSKLIAGPSIEYVSVDESGQRQSRLPTIREINAQKVWLPWEKSMIGKTALNMTEFWTRQNARAVKMLTQEREVPPAVFNTLFETGQRVLKTLQYNFRGHELLDIYNPNAGQYMTGKITNSENEPIEMYQYMLYAPGSLTPDEYTHQFHIDRLSQVAENSAVIRNLTAHVDPMSMVSAANVMATRLKEMTRYVQPGEKVGLMGHSLGGVIIELAFGLLTKSERKKIAKWDLQIITLGSPQYSRNDEIPDSIQKILDETGLQNDFSQMLSNPDLCSNEEEYKLLSSTIDQWQQNGFGSLNEVRLPAEFEERHISGEMKDDIIVRSGATHVREPAQNLIIQKAEHLFAVHFPLDQGRWNYLMKMAGDRAKSVQKKQPAKRKIKAAA